MTHLKYCVCFSLCITAVYVCFCYDAGVCIYHCCLSHITVCLITFCLCSCRFCVMMKVLLITSWTPCCKRQMACHSPALLSGSLHPLTAESVTTPPLTTWTARRCRPPTSPLFDTVFLPQHPHLLPQQQDAPVTNTEPDISIDLGENALFKPLLTIKNTLLLELKNKTP